jgi:hypothetical protein
MSREHIRNAEQQLKNASRVFYLANRRADLREHLIKAVRHITKVLLATRYNG